MRFLRVGPPFAVVLAVAALAACGGGGGGGSTGGGGGPIITPTVPPTITPTVPPTAPPSGSGYVAPTGAVTLLTATSGGAFASAITPSSADGIMDAVAAGTPTEPPSSGSALTQWATTVKETSGVGTQSSARAAQSARMLQAIAQNHELERGDTIRENVPNVAGLRALFSHVRGTRTSASTGRRAQAAQGTVGTQRQFKILTSNIGNSGGCAGGGTSGTYICNTTITATLEAVGAHGNVWVDNASLATPGEFTSVPGDFQTIASRFDGYYATETAAYGPAFYPGSQPIQFTWDAQHGQCDSSGNALPQSQWQSTDLTGNSGTSIDIVITDALAGTGEGGYFYIANEIPQQVWDCAPAPKPVSNYTSMVVVTGNNYSGAGAGVPAQNENYWLNTDIPRSVSHELQHLLHAHYKYFRPIATSTGNGSFDDTFIDEGDSMLAEDLATDPSPGQHLDTPRYSFSFLLEPSLFSLTSFTGFQPNPTSTSSNPPYGWFSNTAGSYGQAYLFQRYLYDRFGGTTYLHTLYNTPGPGVGPVVAGAGGESWTQLYREFVGAVSAQSTSAQSSPYAFSSAVTLRGNVDVPSIRTGAQSTRHLGFGGPQPPETFNANVPNGIVTLAPGTTITTNLIDGAALYLPSGNNASGVTIGVSAPGAASLEGILIQGTLPTPPPSSS
jgi:hypothetical protein